MSATEDEIKIDLDAEDAKKAAEAKKKADPVAPADDIEVKTADPAPVVAKPAVITPEAGVEKLKKQLEQEKELRAAAESRAQAAAEAEVAAKTETHDNHLHLLTNAIATVKQSTEALKKNLSAAYAAGDFDQVAEIQVQMSDNSAKLLQLETGKANLEKAPKPVLRQPVDVVDQFASRLTPRSAAWVREHPDFVRDKGKNQQMLAAHDLAMARGYKVDTDEYFASIEHTLDLEKKPDPVVPDIEDPTHSAAREVAQRKSAAPAAAPVSRSGNGASNHSNQVTLTREEVEMAEMMGMTKEEYARNKVALKKEGRIN